MINALSPLDGRYANKVDDLRPIFSEFGLAHARTEVEVRWLIFLSEKGIAPTLDTKVIQKLEKLIETFGQDHFSEIKDIEKTTNHDVKAVEMFLRSYVPESHWSWIHFACTSEDINNTSYGLLLTRGREVLLERASAIVEDLRAKALDWADMPLLSRTHGQTATPTTLGKEFAVYVLRLNNIFTQIGSLSITAKINGATGNYAAHKVAFPDVDWIDLSQEFITHVLGLVWNPLTTQIEAHDQASRLLNEMGAGCSILIDLCRDVWGYISLGYFGQKVIKGEVGSSTMPHKVNPIDFENAEGNFKLARGMGRTLADELPISRWQRDLTDSTLQRNFGVVFGHMLLGFTSLQKGLGKLQVREENILRDLHNAPEVLTEAIQTVLRAHGHADAYDQLKVFSRGKALNAKQIKDFIQQTDLPDAVKASLTSLTPETYTGLSGELVRRFLSE